MEPAVWRKREGLTLRKLALLFQIGWSSLRRYERGERDVPTSLALLYERVSKGAVTAEDLNRVRKRYLRTEEGDSAAA